MVAEYRTAEDEHKSKIISQFVREEEPEVIVPLILELMRHYGKPVTAGTEQLITELFEHERSRDVSLGSVGYAIERKLEQLGLLNGGWLPVITLVSDEVIERQLSMDRDERSLQLSFIDADSVRWDVNVRLTRRVGDTLVGWGYGPINRPYEGSPIQMWKTPDTPEGVGWGIRFSW